MKKTFRLFISSTFNDFRREREVLQTKVFPHAKEYASKHGYTFQPIDLRWGVSNEAQLDQKTLELCLSEVRACKSHVHPNFLIMIGDRYGWIPLPYVIQTDEFETLTALMTQSDKDTVLEWYKKDLNQLPASYIIKERSGEYEEFERWSAVETNIRTILQSAVKTSNLAEEQKRKYLLSATEAEVEEGIIPYIQPTKYQIDELLSKDSLLQTVDSEHIFGFFRDIDKSTKIEDKFIIDDYEEAQLFKERVASVLEDKNILHVKTMQIDEERLEETYLIKFEVRITEFLKSQIDAQKEKEADEQLTSLQIELQAQSYFAQIKRKDFLAQESLRETIANYISDDNQQPCIIYGASGRGKSSLMAKAIQGVEALHKRVIYRFVGATPYSSSSKEILTCIFDELGVNVRSEQEKIQTQEDKLALNANEKQESFEDFSYRIYSEINNIKENIVIFIDAVDQLGNDDAFLWLPTTLPKNVKIVISALNDASYKDDSRYFTTLKTKTQTMYEIPEFSEPKLLLAALLKKEDRTLQKEQETYFLEQFKSSSSPLYVSVAAQELKNWKSYDNNQEIESTQQGIIKEFVKNLHSVYHHNEEFVHKVLGYLYASRDGLSESELLQLISTDEEFIQRMAPETWHENSNKELPLVHWSRLQTQLKPFLNSKIQDGEELMYFFHREFEDVINNLPNQREEHEAIIKANQKFIEQNLEKPFEQNRWGKLYATLITEYELRCKEKEKQQEYSKFLVSLKNEDWIDEFLVNISAVGSYHYVNNRMYQAIAYTEASYYAVKPLYTENPVRWAKHYTGSLSNLAFNYEKQNRSDEERALRAEALKITKSLYAENPTIWAEFYIRDLISLASYYGAQNRPRKAIKLLVEAQKITKPLNAENPAKWAKYYFLSLINLASYYGTQKAVKIQEEALKTIKELYAECPTRWAQFYSGSLIHLASSYTKQKRFNEAIKLQLDALEITKSLYAENPARWAEEYTSSLSNLAVSYNKERNHLDEAIELQVEALKITKSLYAENPARWAEDYARNLNNLAQYRLNEGIKLHVDALEITKSLYAENPARWAGSYIINLENLAKTYRSLNLLDKAMELEDKLYFITGKRDLKFLVRRLLDYVF